MKVSGTVPEGRRKMSCVAQAGAYRFEKSAVFGRGLEISQQRNVIAGSRLVEEGCKVAVRQRQHAALRGFGLFQAGMNLRTGVKLDAIGFERGLLLSKLPL